MTAAAHSRRRAARTVIVLGALMLFSLFAALGSWQVERRAWKLALIERVDARVHAPPTPAPSPPDWPQVNAASDEYRHVRVAGSFVDSGTTRVQAVSELGAGFWLLTPLRQANGAMVLVNRGFVGADASKPAPAPASAVAGAVGAAASAATVTVTGLLRLTEPGGGFLRHNDAAANRWYSRDVQAIAAAHGLSDVAPFFIDADAAPNTSNAPNASNEPVGGLTVVTFHNNHLVYAITWYTLAVMVAWGAWRLLREEPRARPD